MTEERVESISTNKQREFSNADYSPSFTALWLTECRNTLLKHIQNAYMIIASLNESAPSIILISKKKGRTPEQIKQQRDRLWEAARAARPPSATHRHQLARQTVEMNESDRCVRTQSYAGEVWRSLDNPCSCGVLTTVLWRISLMCAAAIIPHTTCHKRARGRQTQLSMNSLISIMFQMFIILPNIVARHIQPSCHRLTPSRSRGRFTPVICDSVRLSVAQLTNGDVTV